ncbi:MAG: hypothetical protein IT430_02110 [Phycisphaerales bacterium]|nr:hypothetical protein [Phycisphaerales bacterium]
MPTTRVTLRALEGTPLQHENIRTMVIATAEALAERQGLRITQIEADEASVTATVAAERIVAIGFAAELRRLTTNWYRHKFGVDTLWGEPHT